MATITSSGGSYNYLFTVGAGGGGLPVNNPTFTGTMTGGVYGQVVTNPAYGTVLIDSAALLSIRANR